MTKKDILRQENEHSGIIHLHKEGAFWKAYEYSAYMFVFGIMKCKPQKQVFRDIDGEMVHIGFPLASLEKYAEKYSFVSKDDLSCSIKPISFTPDITFENWKKSIDLYVSQRKELSIGKSKEAIESDVSITNKLRSFNIESKTPMDCMMFLIELKKIING